MPKAIQKSDALLAENNTAKQHPFTSSFSSSSFSSINAIIIPGQIIIESILLRSWLLE